MTDRLREQYEAYPYPARVPADEAKRLITGSPSQFDEVIHYVFGGRLDFGRPLKALFAGGGTGDGLVMLAQQCADAGIDIDITYVDLSSTARAIAEGRIAARQLGPIRFVTGSLLDIADLAPGPYDYIDCCGVLHHLDDPAAGLAQLGRVLAPGGGMGLMLYGRYGRTGVYELQSALRRLTGDLPPRDRVTSAKRLVDTLPEGNWFRANPLLGDHRASDAGLYDLLLHSRDRAYTVPEIATLVEVCGLAIAAFVPAIRYDPLFYLTDGRLRQKADALAPIERAALAEELCGALKTHVFYVTRPEDVAAAVAQPDRSSMRPVLREVDGPAMAKALKPGQGLTANFNGLKTKLPLPPLAAAMLSRIDGHRDLSTVHGDLRELRRDLDWPAFKRQFDQLYATMNGLGKLFLRT